MTERAIESRILMLCGLVENIAEKVFCPNDIVLSDIYRVLHEIKLGIGDLKECRIREHRHTA